MEQGWLLPFVGKLASYQSGKAGSKDRGLWGAMGRKVLPKYRVQFVV